MSGDIYTRSQYSYGCVVWKLQEGSFVGGPGLWSKRRKSWGHETMPALRCHTTRETSPGPDLFPAFTQPAKPSPGHTQLKCLNHRPLARQQALPLADRVQSSIKMLKIGLQNTQNTDQLTKFWKKIQLQK